MLAQTQAVEVMAVVVLVEEQQTELPLRQILAEEVVVLVVILLSLVVQAVQASLLFGMLVPKKVVAEL
jgi:hypothetical protein